MNTLCQKNNFSILNFFGFLAFVLFSQSSPAANFPPAGDSATGSKVWADNCTRCHNMRNPSDLSDEQWVTSAFHMRVRAGLTGQETRDLITFLQASNGQSQVQVSQPVTDQATTEIVTTKPALDGKDVYNSSCIACHGANGKGALPGVPDFTEVDGRLSKDDKELLNNIINGYQTPGNTLPMPAKGGNSQLSNADIEAVLKFMKKTFKP